MKKKIYVLLLLIISILSLASQKSEQNKELKEDEISNIINNSLTNVENKKNDDKKQEKNKNDENINVVEENSNDDDTLEIIKIEKENVDLNNPDSIYRMCLYYISVNLFESAYDLARQDKSGDVRNIFMQATAARMIGKYNEAIEKYNKVLQINPNHLKSMLGLGLAYRGKQDISKALHYLEMYNNLSSDVNVSSVINELKGR